MITIKGGPWVALPNYLTYGSIGYMLSPTWLASLADIPQRTEGGPVYDAAVAATPADGDPAQPVGLGAFVFESYTPGNGNAFRAVRNEDYWRGPNGITGEDLPYLDAIEAVAAVDIDSRQSSLRSGEFDAMHTANSDAISQLLDDDGVEVSSSSRFGDTSYYMINVAAGPELDPEGKNAANPLLNVHCRRALAHAMDRERMTQERGAGPGARRPTARSRPARSATWRTTGSRRTTSTWRTRRWTSASASWAPTRIDFRFDTTNDPFNVETGALVQSMWNEAFGDKVTLDDHTRSSRASTSASPSSGTSTSCRVAATAASTPTSSGCGGRRPRRPGRQARPQRQPHQRRRDRRAPCRSSSRTPTRPPARRLPRRSTGASASRSTSGGGAGRCGASPPSRTSTASSATSCPTARRASGWRSPAATRSTRSGATRAAASDSWAELSDRSAGLSRRGAGPARRRRGTTRPSR